MNDFVARSPLLVVRDAPGYDHGRVNQLFEMSTSGFGSFEELDAWKNCRPVKLYVRDLVKYWPDTEKFRLTDQIIRSSRSPGSHLAEGFGRYHEKDNIRYCRMAKGELYETRNHLWDALDEAYITEDQRMECNALIERALKTINGYIAYLQRHHGGSSTGEPEAPYDFTPI